MTRAAVVDRLSTLPAEMVRAVASHLDEVCAMRLACASTAARDALARRCDAVRLAVGGNWCVRRSLHRARERTCRLTMGRAALSAWLHLLHHGALANLVDLTLDGFGVMGVVALAKVCRDSGALPNLEELYLYDNRIGDAGVAALAAAVGSGSLPQLKTLDLGKNQIGDVGVASLATAADGGALTNVTRLALAANRIGDRGLEAVANACARGALPKLRMLYLDDNAIGDAGLKGLADARAGGALPKLTWLSLGDNPLGDARATGG